MLRALPLLLILGGCAGVTARAPSLLPRAIESRGDEEPLVSNSVAQPDPALNAQIADRAAAVDMAARGFAEAARVTETRVLRAKGAAQGSDRWLDAQTAIADLGTARAATDGAVADLEALAIDRAQKLLPPYPALDAALEKAMAELGRENELAARLSGTPL